MCGIVGALSFDSGQFQITASYITAMRDTMTHRGPDGAGVWISPDGRIGLGHRRLSIIDLSNAASQPMSNETGSIWLIFNGEIYNHAEIRTELNRIGKYRWRTNHSDSEVIIHAYEQWGIKCLDKFRGMFAFALWDSDKRELWLVRDRVGVKPLYYSLHHGRITFASEIKALLKDPQQKRALDETSLYHYLSFLTTPSPDTLFDGIKKLPAGCLLKVTPEGLMEKRRWWDVLDNVSALVDTSEESIAEQILEELRTSVQLRKVSDVPVGVFLSGGIDSSANASLFSEGEQAPIHTFTISYDGHYKTYQNESHYAQMMAERVGAVYHEKKLTQKDLIDFLPTMVRLQDEPIADPVCFPVYYVSKLARDNGVIVCQVGEGADELYCGYRRWKAYLQLQRFNNLPVPKWVKGLGLHAMASAGKKNSIQYELLSRGLNGLPIFWGGAEAYTESHKRQFLSTGLSHRLSGLTSWDALAPIYNRFIDRAWEKSPLNWMTYLDLNLRLPELLLMRVDKMSMGVSLEARVPFLDHKFVELAMSIPQAMKTKNGKLKYMLKKAVKNILPAELINRPKQGFGVPIREWFLAGLGTTAAKEIESFCRETDYFDRREVQRIISGGNVKQIWYLLNLSLWWKEHFASRASNDNYDIYRNPLDGRIAATQSVSRRKNETSAAV